jgi:hypothetical protein
MGPLRLSKSLMVEAERKGLLNKRTVPKQIEYWAELGKTIEKVLSYEDIIAVMEGIKNISVEPLKSQPVDPDEIFNSIEKNRKAKKLSYKLTSAPVYFEASIKHSGLLDRVDAATGKRQSGRFVNGEFIEHDSRKTDLDSGRR